MRPAVVTIRLEEHAEDVLLTAAVLSREVENADEVLIPDSVAEAARKLRAAIDRWRRGK